jgi:hypothetical protein
MGQEKRKVKGKNNLEVEPESQPKGMVESTLHSLGKIIPGFGELVKGLRRWNQKEYHPSQDHLESEANET